MIGTNIQSVLEQICDSYGTIINSDTLPMTPFCVHDENISETLRDKDGIYGFVHDVSIMIVGDDDAQLDPLVESVVETMELLSDGLIEETVFVSSSGLKLDEDKGKYYIELNFKCTTNNL